MERESSLEERERKDREKAEANRARQIRQGVVSAPDEEKKKQTKPKAEVSTSPEPE